MLSVHCGFLPIELQEFYYPEYKDCIRELGIKLNFESISHVLGNSYADAGEMVSSSNPFNYSEKPKNQSRRMTKADALAMIGQIQK